MTTIELLLRQMAKFSTDAAQILLRAEQRRNRLKSIRERHGDLPWKVAHVSSATVEEVDELLNRGCLREDVFAFVAAAASAGLDPVTTYELFESLRGNTKAGRVP